MVYSSETQMATNRLKCGLILVGPRNNTRWAKMHRGKCFTCAGCLTEHEAEVKFLAWRDLIDIVEDNAGSEAYRNAYRDDEAEQKLLEAVEVLGFNRVILVLNSKMNSLLDNGRFPS